jgi:spermidine/putrescine-binding protein
MQSSITDVLVSDKQQVKTTPQNMSDWFDTKAYPVQRSAYDWSLTLIEEGLIKLGLGKTDVPTNAQVDQVFSLIKLIKPYIRTMWDSADQSMQLLRSGEAPMSWVWNRIGRDIVAEDPERYAVTWTDGFYEPAYDVVVKGAPHQDLAFEYLKWYATHPKEQGAWATKMSYGVASAEAQKLIDPAAAAWLPESHPSDLREANYEWWADNDEEMTKRYNNVMGA